MYENVKNEDVVWWRRNFVEALQACGGEADEEVEAAAPAA